MIEGKNTYQKMFEKYCMLFEGAKEGHLTAVACEPTPNSSDRAHIVVCYQDNEGRMTPLASLLPQVLVDNLMPNFEKGVAVTFRQMMKELPDEPWTPELFSTRKQQIEFLFFLDSIPRDSVYLRLVEDD